MRERMPAFTPKQALRNNTLWSGSLAGSAALKTAKFSARMSPSGKETMRISEAGFIGKPFEGSCRL